MVASRTPGPIGLSGKPEDLRDGTSIRDLSPQRGPLGLGVSSPDSVQSARWYSASAEWLFQRLRNVVSGDELQRVVVALLGPQCFSAGVIAGIGADIIGSVVDLVKLIVKFVMADLYDLKSNDVRWWQYMNPTVAPRLILAKLADEFFGDELRQAAVERDALLKELASAFENPKATFEGLADSVIAGYEKDWQDYKAHMAAGTLEGRFRAGMIFGKLLIVILGLITGVVGAARVGAKVVSKLPRLAEYARKIKTKRSAAPVAKASDAAQTPSQLSKEKPQESAQAKPRVLSDIEQRRIDNEKLRNSPRFQEDMKKVGVTEEQIAKMSAKEVPLGFKNQAQFQNFKQEMSAALKKDGLGDAEIGMKGTATTFYSENPGKALGHHWDADRLNPGDYDLNITSNKMVSQMEATGIKPSDKYGIFKTKDVEAQYPELGRFAEKWSEELGRDVNFVGYPKPQVRDATEFILTGGGT